MEPKLDFENETKWSGTMDKELHLKTYKSFLVVGVATLLLVVLTLVLMAAFLV